MAYEKKDGDISLFKNDKGGNDKRPDMRGEALIDGRSYRVSLWTRTSGKDGSKFLSGKIELAPDKAPVAPTAQTAEPASDSTDGLPF